MKSLDLTTVLPPRYRDRTIDSLIKNLFNKHLSKQDSTRFHGYIGTPETTSPNDIKINEISIERELNQLSPIVHYKTATEEVLFTWPEMIQKLLLQGVDYETIGDWFKSVSYNLVPPIDLDKFCNFNEYFWIGNWIKNNPEINYSELGVASPVYLDPALPESINPAFDFDPDMNPQYYVIERGDLSYWVPLEIAPNIPGTWSSWSLCNLWVHRDDIFAFNKTASGSLLSLGDLIQATRPIIEYDRNIRLNTYIDDTGAPSETGTYNVQKRTSVNQPPLFDLYRRNGQHLGKTSSLFYYEESIDDPIDSILNRRVKLDSNGDFVFGQSLVDTDTDELLFYKNANTEDLKTIWEQGPEVGSNYVKYETIGTIINQDKFQNFSDYFWTGIDIDSSLLPAYNSIGLSEYYVIEKGGTSDWSVYNFWVHISQLKKSDLYKYVQAIKPIIEFNVNLESELFSLKTQLYQVPQFKHYLFNDVTNDYDVTSLDSYMDNKVISRVSDLPTNIQVALLDSTELLNSIAFNFNDELYAQTLSTGEFLYVKENIELTPIIRKVNFIGTGNGTLNLSASPTPADPLYTEVITLVYNLSGDRFAITGSITGDLGYAPVDVITSPYQSGFVVNPSQGTTVFEDGDTFILEIKSSFLSPKTVYVKIGDNYRTIENPIDIINEQIETIKIPATPSLRDGTWEIPPQIWWNVQNETRTSFKFGDLFSHFSSIIKVQPDLVGVSTGKNNWRDIDQDLGLGGIIKQYDKSSGLLISLLMQDGITIPSLIEFAKENYSNLFVQIDSFIQEQVPLLLVSHAFEPPVEGSDEIDPNLVSSFKEYFSKSNPIVAASASTIDDYISVPFYDSTSSIFNLVVTLPYLGLAAKVLPKKMLDLEQNVQVLVHHDGHCTNISSIDIDIYRSLVTKKYMRSSGQETTGFITGNTLPDRPYKGQFWYKVSTGEFFFYDVISDTAEKPDADIGTFSYDRLNNELFQYNGEWVSLGSNIGVTSMPWKLIKLDLIQQNLILALEKDLYDNCPTLTNLLDEASLISNTAFEGKQKREFEKFTSKHGITDPYTSIYDPENAFTWNYRDSLTKATWQEVYRDTYGTPRPDLEPWISCGYPSESSFILDLVANSLVPGMNTVWDNVWWTVPDIRNFIKSKLLLLAKPQELSVDINGVLLPPYSLDIEGLSTVVPSSASSSYVFGELGPIELLWNKSIDYSYAKQKIFFKLDPLNYVTKTWGTHYKEYGNQLQLNRSIGKRESPSDFILHGDPLPPRDSSLNVFSLSFPNYDVTYNIKCVSRLERIFKISGTIIDGFEYFSSSWTDPYVNLFLDEGQDGFYWGDTFEVKLTTTNDFLVNVTVSKQTNFIAEGFNQLYTQYNRVYGQDLSISNNRTALQDWNVKLGYRFAGMINTDALDLKIKDSEIITDAYNVYIKENKFNDSVWINGIRVQLVQKGATTRYNKRNVPVVGSGGTPGEDWVYRVDNFNVKRPNLSWYQFDLNGESTEFVALSGEKTLFNWKKFTDKTNVITYPAPFLITGIQNVINFIFGYEAFLLNEGFDFNDEENPNLDKDTNRLIDYQLLIEKFIDQQFSSIDAGAAFIFNPFSRKLKFNTPHGTLSNLNDIVGSDQETLTSILDENGKPIDRKKIRVFRQADKNFIVFDQPVYTLHLFVSEYEHVVLFENYAIDTLIFDTFLGQKIDSIFIKGEKQSTFNGRVDLGGSFLLGNQMKRNLENSVSGILKMYDSTTDNSQPEVERVKSSLGFIDKTYFDDRGSSNHETEFKFWQGLIANKGTNLSIDAFVNSSKYKTASLDEYWAYKMTTYGNFNATVKSDLKVELDDCFTQKTNYLFLEGDEDAAFKFKLEDGRYDMFAYNDLPYDFYRTFNSEDSLGMEYIDHRGMIVIGPSDESRWHRLSDLSSFKYINTQVIGTKTITPTNIFDIYQIFNDKGELVRADCFEIIDLDHVDTNESGGIYYENGNYIPGTNPPEYTVPIFERLNSFTIKLIYVEFTNHPLLNKNLKIVAYGPALRNYSPSHLINYDKGVLIKDDIIWWDPARGINSPEAISNIDYIDPINPAKYNSTYLPTAYHDQKNDTKPWGENQIGKFWWSTSGFNWKYYHDSKIYTDVQERFSNWGAISDRSVVKVYEWVKSKMDPITYESTLNDQSIVIKNTLSRQRTWWQRPVAWKFSLNPSVDERSFLAYQPNTLNLILSETNVGLGTAILSEGNFEDYNIVKGSKISAAVYSSNSNKIDSTITSIFGTAEVTSEKSKIKVGSTNNISAEYFNPSDFFTFSLEIIPEIVIFRSSYTGLYSLSYMFDPIVSTYWIKLTYVPTGYNQWIEIGDTPVTSGTQDFYFFDKLGIKLLYTPLFGYSDSWPTIGITTPIQRKEKLALALGHANHDIFVRSEVDVFAHIPFALDGTDRIVLEKTSSDTPIGWIAWNDPLTNPIKQSKPPFNKHSALLGEWSEVGNYLSNLVSAIDVRQKDPWIWFDNETSYNPYKSSWTDWEIIPLFKTINAWYNINSWIDHTSLMIGYCSIPDLTESDILKRVKVLVNEVLLNQSDWEPALSGDTWYINIDPFVLKEGDSISISIYYDRSLIDLSFDPAVSDLDSLKLDQYKIDYPHVYEKIYNDFDKVEEINYYFWVQNKQSIGYKKTMTCKDVAFQLGRFTGLYAVPQGLKWYNQLDGRPNRYGILSIDNLGFLVKGKNAYKLRITYDQTVDQVPDLSPPKLIHEEWITLRKYQTSLIPKVLWDKLTDSLTGENYLGESLPSINLIEYDKRNQSTERYGFGKGQVLVNKVNGLATLKYTILNTGVHKYINDEFVIDYISYPDFDINKLDTYLLTPTSIRKFMTDLWRSASPKQINEIFFEILEDAAAENLEMTDFFKTSFISLIDIRTVNSETLIYG